MSVLEGLEKVQICVVVLRYPLKTRYANLEMMLSCFKVKNHIFDNIIKFCWKKLEMVKNAFCMNVDFFFNDLLIYLSPLTLFIIKG